MLLTIFAKKRKTNDGKEFYSYITKMTKKDGTELTATVKFPDELKPKATECPLNIEIDKTKANLTCKTVTTEDGEIYERNTLWVKAYERSKTVYKDTSLDDFE